MSALCLASLSWVVQCWFGRRGALAWSLSYHALLSVCASYRRVNSAVSFKCVAVRVNWSTL